MRQFNTLTGFLLSKSSNPTTDDTVEFQGYDTVGVGASKWRHNGVTAQTPSQSPAQLGGFTLNDANGNQWQWSGGAVLTGMTISIPSDFATLQAAIDFIQPVANVSSGVLIDLKIESGHSPSSGVMVKNLDCGYFTITSVDAIVNLPVGFTGGSVESTATNCFIVGDNSIIPTLGCLVNANDFCDGGYVVYSGSKGHVLPSCGVTYSSKFGLYVLNDSKCNATNCDFSYVGLVNRVTTNSQLHAEGGNFSNAQDRGTPDANGDRGGLDVSRGSIVNIKTQGANVTTVANSANNGLSVRRSVVSAEEILANNCAGVGVRAETGCLVTVAGSTITNCGDVGIFASFGSTVNAFNASVAGCTNYGIQADNCATVAARDVIATGITGVGRAIYSANASTIDFRGGDASGALSVGLYAINGGAINATSATVDMTGSNAGSYAILCDYGSNVTAALGAFSNSTSGQDIRCTRGSTVAASGSTGVISKTANTVDVNGIIYK
tara:strand:+ start:1433 stop:2914 length:1482 start_codon:yes stop_codon:yes gene_type:complete